MKYYTAPYHVILTRKDNGRKMPVNYYGYNTKREAIEIAAKFNSIKDSPVIASVEKK